MSTEYGCVAQTHRHCEAECCTEYSVCTSLPRSRTLAFDNRVIALLSCAVDD